MSWPGFGDADLIGTGSATWGDTADETLDPIINTSITNQVSYNPVINIEGGTSADVILEALAQDKEGFARFVREEVTDKGYN